MGTRTVQILGKAFSTTGDVSIVCNFNGVEVHNGTVITVNSAAPEQNTTREPLFTFEVADTLFDTTIASSFVVSNGTAFIAGMQGNKGDRSSMGNFYIGTNATGPKTKTNVTLDGVLLDLIQPQEGWHYPVEDGSTLEIDWVLTHPQRTSPGRPGPVTLTINTESYKIITAGNTDFTAIGSADNNVGTVFTATGVGTGTGTVEIQN